MDLAAVVRGLGVTQFWRVNPLKYKDSLAATKEAVAASGVRVLLAQSPCPLYVARLKGKRPTARFQITGECGDCRHCLEYLGCPAMYVTEAEGRRQLLIDPDLCAGCAFCVQLCDHIRPAKKA